MKDQHVGADAGAGVDEDDVGAFLELGQGVDQALAVVVGQVGHPGQARGAADQAKSARRLDQHVAQFLLAGDDVGEVAGKIDVAKHVGVGQAKVGIEQDDALARRRQLDGEVDGDVALADAAFAAGDGDDAGAPPLLDQRSQLRGLVNENCHSLSCVCEIARPATRSADTVLRFQSPLPRISWASRLVRPTSMSSGTSCPVVM